MKIENGPHIEFDEALLSSPFNVTFDKDRYIELLKHLDMRDGAIDALRVKVSGRETKLVAGVYNSFSKRLTINVGHYWDKSTDLDYVNVEANKTLFHESRHASETVAERLKGLSVYGTSAGLVVAAMVGLDKAGLNIGELKNRYKAGIFAGGYVAANALLYFTPLSPSESEARKFADKALTDERWQGIIDVSLKNRRDRYR